MSSISIASFFLIYSSYFYLSFYLIRVEFLMAVTVLEKIDLILSIMFFDAYSLAYFSSRSPLQSNLKAAEVTLLIASKRKSWILLRMSLNICE